MKGLTAPVASSVVNVLAFLFALASSAVPEDSSAPPPIPPPPPPPIMLIARPPPPTRGPAFTCSQICWFVVDCGCARGENMVVRAGRQNGGGGSASIMQPSGMATRAADG